MNTKEISTLINKVSEKYTFRSDTNLLMMQALGYVSAEVTVQSDQLLSVFIVFCKIAKNHELTLKRKSIFNQSALMRETVRKDFLGGGNDSVKLLYLTRLITDFAWSVARKDKKSVLLQDFFSVIEYIFQLAEENNFDLIKGIEAIG